MFFGDRQAGDGMRDISQVSRKFFNRYSNRCRISLGALETLRSSPAHSAKHNRPLGGSN